MISIRPAEAGDMVAVGELVVRAWREGYRDLMPAEFLATMSAVERTETLSRFIELTTPELWLAVEAGAPVGMIVHGPCRDEPGVGEVIALNVDPARWRQGAGGLLLDHATAALSAEFETGVLWAVVGNERARAFYENRGWVRQGVTRVENWRGTDITDECYRRSLRP